MSEIAIRVSGIGKKYHIGRRRRSAPSLRALVPAILSTISRGRQSRGTEAEHTFWALKDVNFDVRRGEILGIIGRNGAGKSTLLKVLSRITDPTEGEVWLSNHVSSLLEVGTGFHPELTGRDNVYLNGAILGLARREISRRFDEIVAFAGVERFLDTPVKHYSSGMYLRLAFAVAAHLDPEILIVDEVLAVGDAEFQRKCIAKMSEVRGRGRTVLFVSHNLAAIRALCTRCVVLEGGRKTGEGDPAAMIRAYSRTPDAGSSWARGPGAPSSALEYREITVSLAGEQPNLRLRIDARLATLAPHPASFVAFDITTSGGGVLMQALPRLEGFLTSDVPEHHLQVEIDLPPLIPEVYGLTAWVGPHYTVTLDSVENCASFEVQLSPSDKRTFPHASDHGSIVPPSRVTVRNALRSR